MSEHDDKRQQIINWLQDTYGAPVYVHHALTTDPPERATAAHYRIHKDGTITTPNASRIGIESLLGKETRMTIDKNKLEDARSWAENILAPCGRGTPGTPRHNAAEVIQALPDEVLSLPDEWVDADKVRELIAEWRADCGLGADVRLVLDQVESLLPAPRVEVRMGAWAMHPEYGEVLIVSTKADRNGLVRVCWENEKFDPGTMMGWVDHADLSPLPGDEDDEPEGDHFDDYSESAQAVIKASIEDFKHGRLF